MSNEFKINNKSYIDRCLSVILVFIVFVIVLTLMYFIFSVNLKFFYLIISCIIGILLIVSFSIKYIEVESSGMVLSIKNYHPATKGWIIPMIEFPVHMLEGFSIKSKNLLLEVKDENNKIHHFNVRLNGFTKNQVKLLNAIFLHTIEKKSR
jgi:hypothetical protein